MPIRVDSSDDGYIEIDLGKPDYRSAFTMMVWCYVHSDSVNFRIFDVGFTNNVPPSNQSMRAERNRFQDNLNINAEGSSDTSSNNSWEINEWHHLTCLYSSGDSEWRAYLDGVSVATVGTIDSSSWRTTDNQTMAIGGPFIVSGGGAGSTGDATLAYAKCWQRELTVAEISIEMNAGKMQDPRNAVWDIPLFGSYTDQWLEDISGNGNDFSNVNITADATGDHAVAPPVAYNPRRPRVIIPAVAPPVTSRVFIIS